MECLQYKRFKKVYKWKNGVFVLNLIISGMPSILTKTGTSWGRYPEF